MESGIYITVFMLDKVRRISVGKLGEFDFPRGYYFYVGRAKRGLQARVKRHNLKDKPLRWHIDYLSVHADMLGVILIDEDVSSECPIARQLEKMIPRFINRFGASDCRCKGHLFYTDRIE